jgi:ArsR family transcriptional regulator
VCHIQSVLGKSQVITSQHLAYLRKNGMVTARRQGHWMIYSLPVLPSPELEANLKCLRDCVRADPLFERDRAKINKIIAPKSVRERLDASCCPKASKTAASCR